MEYYQIRQDRGIKNQIKPQIKKGISFLKERPVFIPVEAEKEKEYLYFLPVIEKPFLFIREEVKEIWEKYQRGGNYYPCALGHIVQKEVRIYWYFEPREIKGIDKKTKYYKDGRIQELYLSEEEVAYQKVFEVRNKGKQIVIVELEVLEQMWREKLHGFLFERVKVARKEE